MTQVRDILRSGGVAGQGFKKMVAEEQIDTVTANAIRMIIEREKKLLIEKYKKGEISPEKASDEVQIFEMIEKTLKNQLME